MFKTILVAVDGSANSKRAVDVAADLVGCHQAAAILLHVIPNEPLPKEIVKMIAKGEVTESRMEILRDSAEIILQDAHEQFEKAGLSEAKRDFAMGDPAPTILDYAMNNRVDLIVIGHRGLGTEAGFMGSVARKLINMTKISCLVVA
jgi:nucleotide-binding universal stress UspA family protein